MDQAPRQEKVQTTQEILASLKTTLASLAGEVVVANTEVSTNGIQRYVLSLNAQVKALEDSLANVEK